MRIAEFLAWYPLCVAAVWFVIGRGTYFADAKAVMLVAAPLTLAVWLASIILFVVVFAISRVNPDLGERLAEKLFIPDIARVRKQEENAENEGKLARFPSPRDKT